MIFTTEITAINQETNTLCTFAGELLECDCKTINEAQDYCFDNGMGYIKVTGYFIENIEVTDVFIKELLN